VTKRKAAGHRPAGESDQRRRRARRNRQAAAARARAAAPNGAERYAERSAAIEEFLLRVTRGDPLGWRGVEWWAENVRDDLARATGYLLSTSTIRRHAERLGLIKKHNARR